MLIDARVIEKDSNASSSLDRHPFFKIAVTSIVIASLSLPFLKTASAQSVSPCRIAVEDNARRSADASLEYLRLVMDQYHDRFRVYEDVSSAGNHFHAFTKIPDGDAPVNINGSSTDNPHSGATALRCEFLAGGGPFGGFYFQNGILPQGAFAPLPNFGTVPNAGVDLTGARALVFWVRGERGGEVVEFFMGGVGRDHMTGEALNPCIPGFFGPCPAPDSTPVVKITKTLSTQWEMVRLDLSGKALSYVLGGFGWVAAIDKNPSGAVFHLDDIQYELDDSSRNQRLNQPRFLVSFTTEPFQVQPPPVNDFDLVLRNSASIYDNALVLLAFLADGTEDSLRRARLIGDALVHAATRDRSYDDGRLRSFYAAGDISLPPGWTPNGRVGTVPIPGFYVEAEQKFIEIEQKAIDTGNNTWAMISLLALYRRTLDQTYLDAARNLGNFIRGFRNDTGLYKGFQGGLDDFPETPNFTRRIYASTEHNLDVYAAFTMMFRITGEPQWQADAQHAREFVEAMWDSQRERYLTGTIDPNARNSLAGQLPLDVQSWSVLSLPDTLAIHPSALANAERDHRTSHEGFSGFDFNNDKDGVWPEGTGQMAVAYAIADQLTSAANIRRELSRIQQTPPFGDGRGIVAALHEGLSTGFDFKYFRRLHIGAVAWNVFAQLRFNPFYQEPALRITGAEVRGKKLFVFGHNFEDGARIVVDGQPAKTRNDARNPITTLIGKKAGKRIAPGQTVTLQVQNADGSSTCEFRFARSAQ